MSLRSQLGAVPSNPPLTAHHLNRKQRLGHPHKFEQNQIFRDMVAREVNVLKIDAPREGGRGWKRTYAEISIDEDLGDDWKQKMSRGAKYMLEETWVRANDPHYDS